MSPTSTSNPPAGIAAATAEAATALVFVEGLAFGKERKNVQSVVRRLVRSCELQCPGAQFDARWYDAAIEPGSNGKVATIRRTEGAGGPLPVVDVYGVGWAQPHVDRVAKKSWPIKFVMGLYAVLRLGSFIRFFNTAGKKNPKGRGQLALAWLFAAILLAYVAIAALTGAIAVRSWYEKTATESAPATSTTVPSASNSGVTTTVPTTTPTDPKAESGGAGKSPRRPPFLMVLVTAAGAALLGLWPAARKGLSQAGDLLVASEAYLRVSHGLPEATGRVATMVEEVVQARTDRRVVLLGYSFGSLVAIDTIFPPAGTPVKALDSVVSLVTIGAPYDFARACRRSWGETRDGNGTLTTWVNVFSNVDLLGSNFRQDDRGPAAPNASSPTSVDPDLEVAKSGTVKAPTVNLRWDQGIEVTNLNLVQFHGFSSHGLYWSTSDAAVRTVFDEVVQHVFAGSDALDPPAPPPA